MSTNTKFEKGFILKIIFFINPNAVQFRQGGLSLPKISSKIFSLLIFGRENPPPGEIKRYWGY